MAAWLPSHEKPLIAALKKNGVSADEYKVMLEANARALPETGQRTTDLEC